MVVAAMRPSARIAVVLFLFLAPRAFPYEAGLHPYYSYTAPGFAMGNAVASLPAHPANAWSNPGGLAFQEGLLFYAAPHDEVTGNRGNFRDRVFVLHYARPGGGAYGAAFLLRQNEDQLVRIGEDLTAANITEPTFLLSYGRKVRSIYGVGISLFGYQQRADFGALDGDPTVGMNAGVLRRWDHRLRGKIPLELRWGLAALNVGPSYDVGEGEADLPLHFRTGFSWKWEHDRMNHVVGSGDIYYLPRDEGEEGDRWGGGIGLETKISGTVAVRAGYLWDQERDRDGATYGFGVGNEVYPHVGGMIEYAHAPGDVAFADHLGLRIYWIP